MLIASLNDTTTSMGSVSMHVDGSRSRVAHPPVTTSPIAYPETHGDAPVAGTTAPGWGSPTGHAPLVASVRRSAAMAHLGSMRSSNAISISPDRIGTIDEAATLHFGPISRDPTNA